MADTYEIRDPIHRTILITEAERRVVDHPWIQRLRHIRQLGFVSIVYPGAVHDRFQHSLGVMHLAGERFRRLVREQPACFSPYSKGDQAYADHLIRLAGLLHDAGHAPFSHTAERFLPAVEAVRLPTDWYRDGHAPAGRQATHEDLTLALVRGLAAEGVLTEAEARDVAAVLSAHVRRGERLRRLGPLAGILRALVSGELDADRCDYLLRDAHYAGVSYGGYDLSRLIACERIVGGPEGPELGLEAHGAHAVEGLLLARYHMFHQVYFHKTPPAFEYYLEQAVGAGEIIFPLEHGLEDLVRLRDDHLWTQLYAAAERGAPWSRRLVEREPAKLVLRERLRVEGQATLLGDQLLDELRNAGCTVFQRRSHQVFTRLASPANPEGIRLLCESKVLGRPRLDPVAAHSDLLTAFNTPIDLRHTYVLRQDAERAAAVIARVGSWLG